MGPPWPGSRIIKLVNHRKFSKISWALKSDHVHDLDFYAGNYCQSKYNELAGPNWPTWEKFEKVGYDVRLIDNIDREIQNEILQFYNWINIHAPCFVFDVDSSYFELSEFLTAVKKLYDWLNFDDFNPDLVGQFWKRYMELHH